MRILMVGDIVGKPGMDAILATLPDIKLSREPDFIVINGENAAGGRGITIDQARKLLLAGADVVTLGNHTWHKAEIFGFLDREPRLLRPANYPPGSPGRGYGTFLASNGAQVCVANLLGRAMMDAVDDPFRAADLILAESKANGVVVNVIDFHAETTSEKQAFAYYVDGRASFVVGTHTHVQTADERILPRGTAYITDVGMTGPQESVIGTTPEVSIARFRTQMPQRFEVAPGLCMVNAALVTVNRETGKADLIERIVVRDIDCESD